MKKEKTKLSEVPESLISIWRKQYSERCRMTGDWSKSFEDFCVEQYGVEK